MKVFRPAGGNDYSVVGHDGPRTLSANSLNTFSTSFPVKPGDFVGLYTVTNSTPCIYTATGENYLYRSGNLADGAKGTFSSSGAAPDFRLNISAVLDPINTFTLGAITRNKKKGTATETATVPNPGAVTVSGNGVKQASSSGARSAVSVPSAGTVSRSDPGKGEEEEEAQPEGQGEAQRGSHLHPDRRRPQHAVGEGEATEEEGLTSRLLRQPDGFEGLPTIQVVVNPHDPAGPQREDLSELQAYISTA